MNFEDIAKALSTIKDELSNEELIGIKTLLSNTEANLLELISIHNRYHEGDCELPEMMMAVYEEIREEILGALT